MIRRAYLGFLFLTILGVLLIGGCGGDDDPVTPDPNRNSTIVISPVPESLEAPWTLNGPDNFNRSGKGAETLNVYPGDYSIAWGPMDGFETPANESLTLPADVRLTFLGIYNEIKDPTGIWVDFFNVRPGVAPNYIIEVVNTIPDFDVLLYVDDVFSDTVKADAGLKIALEEGVRRLEFVPLNGWTSFHAVPNIQSDMLLNIRYSYIDPPPE